MDYDLRGKRVLVTGATGLIGRNLSDRFLEEGVLVRAMTRNIEKARFLSEAGAEVVQADVTDPVSLRRAVEGCQAVVHLAAVLDEFRPLAYYRAVNVEGTRQMAEAALEAGIERFLHVSSTWAYGFRVGNKIDEHTIPLHSKDPYCQTKLEGEEVVRRLIFERDLPAVSTPVYFWLSRNLWESSPSGERTAWGARVGFTLLVRRKQGRR